MPLNASEKYPTTPPPGLLSLMYWVKFDIRGMNSDFHDDMRSTMEQFEIKPGEFVYEQVMKIGAIHSAEDRTKVTRLVMELFEKHLVEEVMGYSPRSIW